MKRDEGESAPVQLFPQAEQLDREILFLALFCVLRKRKECSYVYRLQKKRRKQKMTELLNTMAEMIQQHMWIAPILSFLAGIITSFTPCSLSSVPMAIAYIGGSAAEDKRKALKLSLTMALGMALTFGIFGSLASALGHLLHTVGRWWFLLLGVIMILMALQIWNILQVLPHMHFHGKITKKGYLGALGAGVLSGVFASHCATPVMIALLAMAAQAGNALWGVFLLALYAVGHSGLLVLAGTSYGVVERWLQDPKYARISDRLRKVLGVVILVMGLLLIWLAFAPGD